MLNGCTVPQVSGPSFSATHGPGEHSAAYSTSDSSSIRSHADDLRTSCQFFPAHVRKQHFPQYNMPRYGVSPVVQSQNRAMHAMLLWHTRVPSNVGLFHI